MNGDQLGDRVSGSSSVDLGFTSMSGGFGSIFVSYRREETRDIAGRLADRLTDHFGHGCVFIDVEAVQPGVDFVEEITRSVARCRVLVVVIGPNWHKVRDSRRRIRLRKADDPVALEVRTGLTSPGVRVVPVLVDGAEMPSEDDLPEALCPLVRINAARLDHETFAQDAAQLIAVLEPDLLVEDPTPRTPPGQRMASRAVGAAEGVRQRATAVATWLAESPEVAHHWLLRRRARPARGGRPPAIIPKVGVAGVAFGSTESRVRAVFGVPERRDDNMIRTRRYLAYPSRGVAIVLDEGRVCTFLLHNDRPTSWAPGIPSLPEWRAFEGMTAEGLSVSSTRIDVEARYGSGLPPEWKDDLKVIRDYPRVGLMFSYATDVATDMRAAVDQIMVYEGQTFRPFSRGTWRRSPSRRRH